MSLSSHKVYQKPISLTFGLIGLSGTIVQQASKLLIDFANFAVILRQRLGLYFNTNGFCSSPLHE